jgi:putative membrane protein
VPWTNYLGWLLVALVLMVGLRLAGGPAIADAGTAADSPILALYLWTYYASVLAHAAFLGLPASAFWGGLGMGLVALPLTVHMVRSPARPVRP